VLVKYCQTPEYTMLWSSRGHDAAIYRPLRESDVTSDYKPLFDVRTMGLVSFHGLSATYETVMKSLSSGKPVAVRESDGIIRLDFPSAGSHFSSTVWLDSKKGYTPIRMEVRGEGAKEARSESEVTWIALGDAWVPKAFLLKERRRRDLAITYALAFDWEAVNSPVSRRLFSWEGFDLPRGAKVVDFRLGRNHPITVAVVGSAPTNDGGAASRIGLGRFVAACVTVLAVVLLAIMAWLRRRNRGRAPAR
jgi:hypothetical protein